MFTVTIETDNAAFDPDPEAEIARILRELAKDIEHSWATQGPPIIIRDINGNEVGIAELS